MWAEYGLFLLRTFTVLVAIALIVAMVAAVAQRNRGQPRKGKIVIEDLNKRLDRIRDQVKSSVLPDRKSVKQWRKQQKATRKAAASEPRKQAWVLDFKGDIQASQAKALSESVSAVLQVAGAGDTVIVRLESPGGIVPGYGLAASQLQRLKDRNLTLWVAVDKVAASGGYMMACIADRIFAAPFAVVGSIGVVAQLPNVNRLLKKHDIDIEMHTAGEYKRTLTVLGENTRAGREKFQESLEITHQLFKQHVTRARPQLDVDAVADGDHWYACDAIERGLVDELATSEDVLLKLHADHRLTRVSYEEPKPMAKQISGGVVDALEEGVERFLVRNLPW